MKQLRRVIELSGAQVDFVSVVKRGANRRPTITMKDDEPDTQSSMVKRLKSGIAMFKQMLGAIAPDEVEGEAAGRIVQQLIVSKAAYERTAAEQWAKEHGFRADVTSETDVAYRLEQFDAGDAIGDLVSASDEEREAAEFPDGIGAVVCDGHRKAGRTVATREATKGFGPGSPFDFTSFDAALADVTLMTGGTASMSQSCSMLEMVVMNVLNSPDVTDKKAAVSDVLDQFAAHIRRLIGGIPADALKTEHTRAQLGLAVAMLEDDRIDDARDALTRLAGKQEDGMTKDQEQKIDTLAEAVNGLVTVLKAEREEKIAVEAARVKAEADRIEAERKKTETPPALAPEVEARLAAVETAVKPLEGIEERIATKVAESITPKVQQLETRVKSQEARPRQRLGIAETTKSPEDHASAANGQGGIFDSAFPPEFAAGTATAE